MAWAVACSSSLPAYCKACRSSLTGYITGHLAHAAGKHVHVGSSRPRLCDFWAWLAMLQRLQRALGGAGSMTQDQTLLSCAMFSPVSPVAEAVGDSGRFVELEPGLCYAMFWLCICNLKSWPACCRGCGGLWAVRGAGAALLRLLQAAGAGAVG